MPEQNANLICRKPLLDSFWLFLFSILQWATIFSSIDFHFVVHLGALFWMILYSVDLFSLQNHLLPPSPEMSKVKISLISIFLLLVVGNHPILGYAEMFCDSDVLRFFVRNLLVSNLTETHHWLIFCTGNGGYVPTFEPASRMRMVDSFKTFQNYLPQSWRPYKLHKQRGSSRITSSPAMDALH